MRAHWSTSAARDTIDRTGDVKGETEGADNGNTGGLPKTGNDVALGLIPAGIVTIAAGILLLTHRRRGLA